MGALLEGTSTDTRVLGIQALENGDLVLEGDEMPPVKVNARAEPQWCRPPCQGGRQ